MIDFYDINKHYGSLHVLKDVNLHITAGEVAALVGPSGSGKSTLLRCINQLERVTSGELIVDSMKVHDRKVDLYRLRRQVGMLPQDFTLYPHMTVLDNLILAPIKVARLSRVVATDIALNYLKKAGLEEKKDAFPSQLSSGEQQKAAMVRALAMMPKIMLFDEPTSALDGKMAGEVAEMIRGLARDGMTMVIATQEMEFARKVANRIFFIDRGKIAEGKNSPPMKMGWMI